MNYIFSQNLLRLLWIEHKLPKFIREEINEKSLVHLEQLTQNMGPELASRFTTLQEKSFNIMMHPHTKIIGCLLMIEENLPTGIRVVINETAEVFLNSLADCIRFCLYHYLDKEEVSEDDLRILVQCVPQVLSEDDPEDFFCDYGEIPLLTMCRRGQSSFVPMLVEEGLKHDVGGAGMRGGLFYKRHNEQCLIGELSFKTTDGFGSLDIIIRLREMGLLKKEDIKNHDLLRCSSRDYKQYVFDPSYREYDPCIFRYFVDWDPSALQGLCKFPGLSEGCSILHVLAISQSCLPCDFQLALRATLRYYPQELGLLLLKNNDVTPFQLAKARHGKEEAWKMIEECLEEPFCSKIAIEKNTEKNLYPFITAAIGDTCELDLVYHLLRRHPLTLEHCTCTFSSLDSSLNVRKRKRPEF